MLSTKVISQMWIVDSPGQVLNFFGAMKKASVVKAHCRRKYNNFKLMNLYEQNKKIVPQMTL